MDDGIDSRAYSVVLVPGKKTVVIHGDHQVAGKFPWAKEAQAKPVFTEVIPEKLHAGSLLTADVDGDQTDLNFDLNTSEAVAP